MKEFQHRVVTVGAAVPPFCWSDVRCQTSKKLPPSAILSTSHTSHGTVMMLCSGSIASLKDRKGSCGVAEGLPAALSALSLRTIYGKLVSIVSGAPPDFRGDAPGIRGRFCLILRFKL